MARRTTARGSIIVPRSLLSSRRLILHRRFGGAECDGDLYCCSVLHGDEVAGRRVRACGGATGIGGERGRAWSPRGGRAANEQHALGDGRVDRCSPPQRCARPRRVAGARRFFRQGHDAELYRSDRRRVCVRCQWGGTGRPLTPFLRRLSSSSTPVFVRHTVFVEGSATSMAIVVEDPEPLLCCRQTPPRRHGCPR